MGQVELYKFLLHVVILSEYCVVTLRQRAKWKINEKLIMVQCNIKYLQQFLYQGERLLDEQGWREEAKGVIKEIVNFVKVLTVSDQLKYRYWVFFFSLGLPLKS